MKTIAVKVVTNANKNEIKEVSSGKYKARITATPEKGKANKQLISLLAKHFNCSKNSVTILKGVTSKEKIISIDQ